MILAGDIGGTNTRLAYFENKPGRPEPAVIEIYPSGKHAHFEDIVEQFVQTHPQSVESACFGIAGPIQNGVCRTPNLPWVVDTNDLSKTLNVPHVQLINDLEANAHGIAALGEEDLVVLNAGQADLTGSAALISAGTGLGEAGLYRDGDELKPFASEGGHTDFAPRNDLEMKLLSYLLRSYDHVSFERVLSGPGLLNIFNFLVELEGNQPPAWLQEQMQKNDPAAVITKVALSEEHATCERAIDLFVSMYGAEAGNLALTTLATGGMFVGGGIAPRIIEKLKQPLFLESFVAKGRMTPLLERIPVKVIVNDKTAMLGAAKVGLAMARQNQ